MRTTGSNQEGSLGDIEGPASRWSVAYRENRPEGICGTNAGFKFKWERSEIGLDLDRLPWLIELANFRTAGLMLFGTRLFFVLRTNTHAGGDEHE